MSTYYIVDDGTDCPWIYDNGEFYNKYDLEIPDWLADDIKGRASEGEGINPDDKIYIYEFDEDDIDKYNLYIINKFFNDYKFSEKIHNGAELKDWLIDRDVCPEQGECYAYELLEFIKENFSYRGERFWLEDIPGIKMIDRMGLNWPDHTEEQAIDNLIEQNDHAHSPMAHEIIRFVLTEYDGNDGYNRGVFDTPQEALEEAKQYPDCKLCVELVNEEDELLNCDPLYISRY